MGMGVLVPATTSSPWALKRSSPNMPLLPSLGFLVNRTPLPLSQPMFPKTMVWTLHAVPMSSLMPSTRL